MPDSEDLLAENAALKARIAALETELENRPRVERLPMFALLDAMPIMVGAVSQDGSCEFMSSAFRSWLLVRRSEAMSRPFVDCLIDSLRPLAQEMIATALSGQMTEAQVSVTNVEGDLRDLQMTIAPRRFGGADVNGCIWVAQDLTHLRLADEALRASEHRLRLATDAAGLGVWDWNLLDRSMIHSERAREILGLPLQGEITSAMLRDTIHPDDIERAGYMARRAIDPALKEKVPYEYRIVMPDGTLRWVAAHGEGLFAVQNGVEIAVRYIGTLQDVTERAQAAQRQQLLMHELNHRVKNTLASVQSIAHLTLRSEQSPDQARARFTDRLVALAGAHDILTRENWEAADLTDIVAAATRPYDSAGAGRFQVTGASVRVAPKTAVALALCLHELATNAAKYGALSVESGVVSIDWRVEGAPPRLSLRWRESGGPPVTPPTRTGFGTRLLTRGLVTEFGGDALVSYEPTGVVCHIDALLAYHELLDLT